MNLIKADLFHYFKDRTSRIIMIIVFVMPLFSCCMYSVSSASFSTDTIIVKSVGTDILCAILGLQISLFIGKDYANNTLRNKLCYGESRYKVVMCYFLESILMTVLFVVISVISSIVFSLCFGVFDFGDELFIKLGFQLLILIAYSVVITSIVVSTKSMKAGFIITLMVAVVLNSISYAMPVLAVEHSAIRVVCRVSYMIVSTMLLAGKNGAYSVGSLYTFENLYINAGLLSLAYIILSVGITALVVKRQSYK